MIIKEINSLKELKACEEEWSAILERSGNNNPFLEFPWIEKWWGVFGHEYEMYVICAYTDSGPVAFLPLMKEKGRVRNKIGMISYPQGNYTDIIAEERWKQACWQEMLDYVLARNPNTLFLLSGFLESSGSAGFIRQYAVANAPGFYTYQVTAPYFNYLADDSYGMMKKRLKNHGVDRKEKRLKKEGTLSFRPIGEEHLEEMYRIHKKRWDEKWDVSGFDEGPGKQFFREVALIQGKALKPIVYGLFFEEELIAFLYGMACRDRFLFYRLAHDDDLGIYSPGKMILNHSIVSASDYDSSLFDFTIGAERYKDEWKTGADSVHHFLFMNRPSLAASVLFRFHKRKQMLAVTLKKQYAIVLFKRNTIGKWRKHARSPKQLLWKCAGLVRSGLRRLLWVEVQHVYKKDLSSESIKSPCLERLSLKAVMAKRAGEQDVRPVVARLYRGEKGFVHREGQSLTDVVWVSGKVAGSFSLPPGSVAIEGTLSTQTMEGLEATIRKEFPGTEQLFTLTKRKSKCLEDCGFRSVMAYRKLHFFGYAFDSGKTSRLVDNGNLAEEK